MSFAIARESYDRYMGRYSAALAPRLIAFAGVEPGMRALDVGCGPGALTAALADRLGATSVAGADPSESLLAACAERVSGADVRLAPAERLPWPEASFDAVLSQLVLNFVPDADAAVDEMRRVGRPCGVVAACTWDYAAGMRMLRTFWDAALELDALAPDEGRVMHYCTKEGLAALWERRGLDNVETAPLDVEVVYQSFEDYWQPFTLGVGPPAHIAQRSTRSTATPCARPARAGWGHRRALSRSRPAPSLFAEIARPRAPTSRAARRSTSRPRHRRPRSPASVPAAARARA